LSGTSTGDNIIDDRTDEIARSLSDSWCDRYVLQQDIDGDDTGTVTNTANHTRQYYGKMWYDSLLNSESFLNLHPGIDDPYNWTLGVGCNYTLGGQRTTYTDLSKFNILYNASRDIYFYDEGLVYGAIDPQLLVGDSIPKVGKYSRTNPLTRVGVLQSQYPALTARLIVDRVKNCHRPGGKISIKIHDANEILSQFKEAMERMWTKGWDDPNENVQFAGYFDDNSVPGTSSRLFTAMTSGNQDAMIIAICILFGVSAIASFRCNLVKSRVLVTAIGFLLVLLGYFAGIGLANVSSIPSNFAISWILPFVIFGFGVDDLFFIL
jgi:Sterol-sensing domain of SREBP cleavage-activation